MQLRKTSNGPQPQAQCSDGAKMLIDQMKEHPEEFRGYAGKFTSMLDMAREANQGLQRNVKMSQRDAAAIMAAAETHLYEVWLAEDVLTQIMQPKEEEQPMKATFAHRAVGKSVLGQMTGANIASSVYTGNGSSNTVQHSLGNTAIGPSYEEYMRRAQMEQERYKMEDFKRREEEYAMRNTKPFKDFP